MKKFPSYLSVAFAALGVLALTGCVGEPSPAASGTGAKPVAVVNGTVVIPNEVIEVIIAEQRAQGAPDDPNMKDGIRKELTRRALLEQDAVKAGINKRPDTLVRQDLARQNALIRDYVQDWAKNNAPTDDEMKQEYEKIKAGLTDQKEYHVRHILLKTEQEAKTAISRLVKGAKFAELARKSLDPGTKDNGGDLGWTNPAMFVPAFSEAMTKLSKGKYTTAPVKTDYGYHVILLEDVRDLQPPSFDDIKPELQQRMQQQRWQAYIDQLEKNVDANAGVKEKDADEKKADEKEPGEKKADVK
ncbi:MAG: peptidylprolyl isomerase [Proteobacteria bacterium]|nr:peptidylprolyl isomerase [Pseudomonadota bacterium]